jgi:hypothetical protein
MADLTRRRRFVARQILLVNLIPFAFLGCARNSEAPPAATAPSAVRKKVAFEAPAAVATQDRPKPTAEAPARPAAPTDPPKPATIDEVHKIIDLSQIAKVKGAEKIRDKPTEVHYSYRGKLADSAEFYRSTMTGLGWTEDTEPVAGVDPDKYVYVRFLKGGFCVGVSAYTEQSAGMIGVHVANQGNVDARRLPKPADAKPLTSYRHFVNYSTALSPDAAADYCRKEFTALGWKDEPVDSFEFHKKEGRTLLDFVDNAMVCLIRIAVKDGKTEVEYMPSIWREGLEKNRIAAAKAKGIPAPATTEEMKEAIDLSQFPRLGDAKPLVATPIYLGYEADSDVAKAVAFCREKLKAAGWTEDPDINMVHEQHAMLFFSNGPFFVDVNIAQEKATDKVTIQIANKGNVDARLLPQPADAKTHGAGLHSVLHYTTGADLAGAAEFCRTELTKLGWRDRSIPARKTEKYIILAFTQNAMRLDIEVQKNSSGRMNVAIRTAVAGGR